MELELELLKKALKPASNSQADYLQHLLEAATAYAERQSGRFLGAARDRTVYLRGNGTGQLFLEGPVGADPYGVPLVSLVTERQYPGDTGNELAADDATGWLVRGDVLVRKGGYSWTRGWEYEVAYTQDPSGRYPDISEGVVKLVTLWYERRLPVSQAGAAGAAEVPHNLTAIFNSHWRPLV